MDLSLRIKAADCSLSDAGDGKFTSSSSSRSLLSCSRARKRFHSLYSLYLLYFVAFIIIVSSLLCIPRVEGRGVAALGKGGSRCRDCPTSPPLEFKPIEHIGILVTLGVIIIIYLGIITCKCYPVLKDCCCSKEKSSSAQNIALSPTSNIQLMNQANRQHRISSHQALHASSRNGRSSRDNNNDAHFISINMMNKMQNQQPGRRDSHYNGKRASRNPSVVTATTMLDVEAAAAAVVNSGVMMDPSNGNHVNYQQHLTSAPRSRRPSSNEVNTITGSMTGQLTAIEGSMSSEPKERRASNSRLSISSPHTPSSRRASSASRKASNASVFINEGPSVVTHHENNNRV